MCFVCPPIGTNSQSSELGKSIGNHPSLQHLLIAHNRLEKVHPNIRHLVHLTRLHLPFNQLANLPVTLSDLRELQVSYYSYICLHTTIYPAYYYISHTDVRLPARIANESLLCELQILNLLYMCPQSSIYLSSC